MKTLAVFLLGLLIATSVGAQVVNVEKKRSQDSTKKFQGFIYIGANFTENKNSVFQGYDKVQVQYQPNSNNLFLLLNEMTMMRVDEESFLDDGFVHLRYNHRFPKRWLILEAFTQYQYDKALNVDSRLLAGIGPRWAIYDRDSIDLFLGTLTMYEREQRTEVDSATEKHRFASYLSANWTFGKKKSLSSIIYYQPRYTDFNDYRVSGEASLKIGFGKKFFYQVTYQVKFDENPPEGVQKFNSSLKNKIGFEF